MSSTHTHTHNAYVCLQHPVYIIYNLSDTDFSTLYLHNNNLESRPRPIAYVYFNTSENVPFYISYAVQ